jgi:PepSY-associated TM region
MKTIVASSTLVSPASNDGWLNYRTVWRWHFYAALFCIPFVIWLSITGSIFLFKPQIERWLDRPYDNLSVAGPRATAEAQVKAALVAVPGSNLHYYELPTSPQSATRIQLILIIPFIRLASRAFHTAPMPLSANELLHAAREHPLDLSRQLWLWEWHAFLLWAAIATVSIPIIALALTPVLRLLLGRVRAHKYPVIPAI